MIFGREAWAAVFFGPVPYVRLYVDFSGGGFIRCLLVRGRIGYGLLTDLSLIVLIAMFVVSGLPVAVDVAPDQGNAFKLTHMIDGAEFLVLVCFLEVYSSGRQLETT